jgi:ParB family chromosome partitioning protein
MFLTIADGTSEFAAALEAARARQETAEDDDGAAEPVRHLRAL